MKRLYAALFFLLLTASLCVFEQHYVARFYDTVSTHIDAATEAVRQEDYDTAGRECAYLDRTFNEEYRVLSLMINHGALGDLGVDFNELKTLAAIHDSTLEGRLLAAKVKAWQIYDNQRISAANIF